MKKFIGKIIELQTDRAGDSALQIECPAAQVPDPGQYLQALTSDDQAALPITLFPSRIISIETGEDVPRFTAAISNSEAYRPGIPLQLLRPLGVGFAMPPTVKRLALTAFDASLAPLLPLMDRALSEGGEVAIFCDICPDGLPEAVEINPLEELRGAAGWADYAALTSPLERLSELDQLGIREMRSNQTQVLVRAPMPCSGLADCGVCAVPSMRGCKLACKDGPVFDWGVENF
ncbi:MAG: hypothetical protein OEV06_02655 [Anaerolineae bacterium]|nr:hypothetical protein [Anaerolineae bacterium]